MFRTGLLLYHKSFFQLIESILGKPHAELYKIDTSFITEILIGDKPIIISRCWDFGFGLFHWGTVLQLRDEVSKMSENT